MRLSFRVNRIASDDRDSDAQDFSPGFARMSANARIRSSAISREARESP